MLLSFAAEGWHDPRTRLRTAYEFRLLGPLRATRDGAPLAIAGPKQRALLALLLLNANEVVSRARALDFLWPHGPPERAVNALQVAIHGLRRTLDPDRIETHGTGYLLRVEPDELDLLRFERLRLAGRDALAHGDAARAGALLADALELWHGDPLADVDADPAQAAEWAWLSELRLATVELRVDGDLALGRHDAVVPELEELVSMHPFRERLRAQLMLALYRAGRQADALEAYRAARRVLGEELGIEPGPALRELERAILRQDPSLRQPAAVTVDEAALPRPATRLVGRRLEVVAVCSLLRGGARLLTLTGPGGVGKTRLAIESAKQLARELEHRAVFVDFGAIADPALVEPTVAAALGVLESKGQRLEQLRAALRDRELLLVLDGFERLVHAAPLLSELISAAPRLRVLVTSRTPLRLTAEQAYAVPPLGVPEGAADVESLARNDAVSLFVARAQAIDAGFVLTDGNAAAVAAICRRLDGLPLALELAAARVRALSATQILERLAEPLALLTTGGVDLPPRQRTLRATIDWSHELLDDESRSLFASLAVFAGGCTLAAAEAVCGAELDALVALLDAGLVRRHGQATGETRFSMLDTVREYAGERLAQLGPGETRARHAEYFTLLAERLGPELDGKHSRPAAEELTREHDNLLAALEYAADNEVELGFRLAAALRRYWDLTPRGHEIRGWLEPVFRLSPTIGSAAEAGALVVLGKQLQNEGRFDEAHAAYERAVGHARRLDRPEIAAAALTYLAWLAAAAGAYEECRRLGEEAIELARRVGNVWAERQGLAMVAGALINLDDAEASRPLLERSLVLAQRQGDVEVVVLAMANSGYGAICRGDLGAARSVLEAGLRLCRVQNPPIALVGLLRALAWEASESAEPTRARAYLREALESIDVTPQISQRVDVLEEIAITLGDAAPRASARLLGAVDGARSRGGSRTTGVPAQRRIAALRAQLGAALSEDELALELADGAQLELDGALEEARVALDDDRAANRRTCSPASA